MPKWVTFSGKHLDLEEIAIYHSDLKESIIYYFRSSRWENSRRFGGYTQEEVYKERECRLAELNHSSALSVLIAIEAKFKIDYLQRCRQRKPKDEVTLEFRAIYMKKGDRASLGDDILEIWKQHSKVQTKLIGELKGALNYRHWLAHGRYWEPKLGRKYDFDSVYKLGLRIFNAFPLIER